MLYTRKGDDGTTSTFGCNQRLSKSSTVAEALGALDEINSFLGLAKISCEENALVLPGERNAVTLIHGVQQTLFIIQAEVAGADMTVTAEKVKELEDVVDSIAAQLPPVKTFFISGGTPLAALFDVARTMARRAERRVVAVAEEGFLPRQGESLPQTRSGVAESFVPQDKLREVGGVSVGPHTKAYLNRLSSLLYALARFANHMAGKGEDAPDYR